VKKTGYDLGRLRGSKGLKKRDLTQERKSPIKDNGFSRGWMYSTNWVPNKKTGGKKKPPKKSAGGTGGKTLLQEQEEGENSKKFRISEKRSPQ